MHIIIKNNRFYFISPLVLLLIGAIFTVSNNTRSDKLYAEDIVSDIRNTDHDQVVTPEKNENRALSSFEDLINFRTNQSTIGITGFLVNWEYLFSLFTDNHLYKQQSKEINNRQLESLTQKIDNVSGEFSLGNVQALAAQYGELIKRECGYYKLDWRLILAMVRQESYFNPNALSHAGAFGLMQLMPRTGAGLQSQLQLDETRSPENNLIAGIYYYATLVASFEFTGEEKYKFALAAYNGGLGRVIDAMTIAAYQEKDYKLWDNVKEAYPLLASSQDSIHALVWPQGKRPQYGTLDNWKEPYNYVRSIMFYYSEYQKIFESNIPEKKKIKKKKTKKK